MGFKGIVVTDALDMAGLTRLYAKDIGRAAVESFKAGNDVLDYSGESRRQLSFDAASRAQRRNRSAALGSVRA